MAKETSKNDVERMERAEEFLAAAREHFAALEDLPDVPKHYPLAYYLAGLAVECLFRAYTERGGGEHDAKHDLRRHAENGRFLGFMPSSQQDKLWVDLNEVRVRWLNNHRYRSVASLRRFLNDAELYRIEGNRTVKGDVVRYNWEILHQSSIRLLSYGIKQWTVSKSG